MSYFLRSTILFLVSSILAVCVGGVARFLCGPMMLPIVQSDMPLLKVLIMMCGPLLSVGIFLWLGLVLSLDDTIKTRCKNITSNDLLLSLFLRIYKLLKIMPNLEKTYKENCDSRVQHSFLKSMVIPANNLYCLLVIIFIWSL